jgi:pimeloyl-ACP methyl ester carboxylesterase
VKTARSNDGTTIAFDQIGAGPPIIIVAGALSDRSTAAPLAEALGHRFSVLTYDRRGRGDSGDTPPYAVEREIEDLDALIVEVGGTAGVFGHCSGAVLALYAAASSRRLTTLALYEPPFRVDQDAARPLVDLPDRLAGLVSAGRWGEAAALYQAQGVGIPPDVGTQHFDASPGPALETIAHTLVYDAMIMADLSTLSPLIGAVQTPTLLIDGEKSWSLLRTAARAVADMLPRGRHCTLMGQSHQIDSEVTAPVLEEFFVRVPYSQGIRDDLRR